MQPVLQDEPSGCGIACVATLACKKYSEIKEHANSIGIFAEDERLYSDTEYVRTLLDNYGINASGYESPFESWKKLPDTALLAIKYRFENGRPFWHWTVFARIDGDPVVLDPARCLKNNIRTDFEMMHPEWFIEIFKKYA